jgi:hypothetical protein
MCTALTSSKPLSLPVLPTVVSCSRICAFVNGWRQSSCNTAQHAGIKSTAHLLASLGCARTEL